MALPLTEALRVFYTLDLAGEIVSFLPQGALLPVSLSCRGLREGVRRILGPDRQLRSIPRQMVSSVSLVQWALAEGCTTAHICEHAAAEGNLHVLKWLREEANPPCPWDSRTCIRAAANGHLHVLKWLREEASPPCP